MDAELSVKLQKLTSNTDMTDRQFIHLLTYVQQEIAKAKEQERNNIIEYVQVNQKGQFEEDSTGSVCWYLDDLVAALKEHKEQ